METVKENKSPDFKKKIGKYAKEHLSDITSAIGLILCVVVFSITSDGNLWSRYNVGILVEQVCVYAVIALGAIFVYAMGYMDVSVGSQLGVYSILMIAILNATGSLLAAFLVVFALAMLCGAFNGAVAVFLKLPSIVTSLFLMFVFGGIQYILIENTGSNSVSTTYDMSFFTQTWVMIVAMAVVGVIVFYLFNFTKLGKYTKGIGANELTTSQCGVNTTAWKVIAYMVFGACVAIGSVFLLARTKSAGKGTGSGYAMDIMICLILGGMPLSGGMKSKVRSALIGSVTYVLLSNGLILSGVDIKLVYLVKAIIFFIVVAVTCRDKSGYLQR